MMSEEGRPPAPLCRTSAGLAPIPESRGGFREGGGISAVCGMRGTLNLAQDIAEETGVLPRALVLLRLFCHRLSHSHGFLLNP